jgi:hypothetical protein
MMATSVHDYKNFFLSEDNIAFKAFRLDFWPFSLFRSFGHKIGKDAGIAIVKKALQHMDKQEDLQQVLDNYKASIADFKSRVGTTGIHNLAHSDDDMIDLYKSMEGEVIPMIRTRAKELGVTLKG